MGNERKVTSIGVNTSTVLKTYAHLTQLAKDGPYSPHSNTILQTDDPKHNV
ncbi:9729_t:CDS:2 [Ambispora leptoticha]|uniref:9729_t:CDS:1 n=1 Tax=Ambispora leptoticha TaxID=144679 RepID=A0A9N9GAM1_9GLOM|nr:9729_t:CDS:2 [Ambispora leptoticha]